MKVRWPESSRQQIPDDLGALRPNSPPQITNVSSRRPRRLRSCNNPALDDTLHGRLGNPVAMANVALFLCSPLASYVTGQTLEVNGGWRG